LDGVRILRAGLIRWKKSLNEVTRIAAKVGIAISYRFMGLEFFAMFWILYQRLSGFCGYAGS
jgi:hypothetical protein